MFEKTLRYSGMMLNDDFLRDMHHLMSPHTPDKPIKKISPQPQGDNILIQYLNYLLSSLLPQ